MTYLADHARANPGKPAMISADTARFVTFGELDERSNRLARYLYDAGLRRGDHIAILMENNLRFMEPVWAAFRSGLYVTAVNRYLPPDDTTNDIGMFMCFSKTPELSRYCIQPPSFPRRFLEHSGSGLRFMIAGVPHLPTPFI